MRYKVWHLPGAARWSRCEYSYR